uniref:Pseudouridine synthase RsuA/RluA-like domain-containing protein n=1 Tax=Trypanosoma congolense (strain IL3000) TaxID=1068625 RepID=G0UXC0_TRYCI|nr:conserved hypothetical protein [Trypanosoma congolense IL3000]
MGVPTIFDGGNLASSILFVLLIVAVNQLRASGAASINSFTVVLVNDHQSLKLRNTPDGEAVHLPPYTVRLSSEWMVINKPAGLQVVDKLDNYESKLLHCRLPIPQDEEAVARQVERYVQLHEPGMATKVWQWLNDAMSSDGCVSGDGEGVLTGVPEWYLFCTLGEIRKVNKTVLSAAYNATSPHNQGKIVRRLFRRVRRQTHGMERSRSFSRWTVRIGEYKKGVSWPRWNVERQLWEINYPTNRPCQGQQEDNVSRGQRSAMYDDSLSNNDERSRRYRQKGDVWETVVRIHCESSAEDKWKLQWSITEIRQTCVHEISLRSPVVCKWNQELKNLHVNPIPCVAI